MRALVRARLEAGAGAGADSGLMTGLCVPLEHYHGPGCRSTLPYPSGTLLQSKLVLVALGSLLAAEMETPGGGGALKCTRLSEHVRCAASICGRSAVCAGSDAAARLSAERQSSRCCSYPTCCASVE